MKLFVFLLSGVLFSSSVFAATKVSCTAQTSINTAGNVTVLPIQANSFVIAEDEFRQFHIPIQDTSFSYDVTVGHTEDPEYDEMAGTQTPGFKALRTLNELSFHAPADGVQAQTSTNRFQVEKSISLIASLKDGPNSNWNVRIFCKIH